MALFSWGGWHWGWVWPLKFPLIEAFFYLDTLGSPWSWIQVGVHWWFGASKRIPYERDCYYCCLGAPLEIQTANPRYQFTSSWDFRQLTAELPEGAANIPCWKSDWFSWRSPHVGQINAIDNEFIYKLVLKTPIRWLSLKINWIIWLCHFCSWNHPKKKQQEV